MVTLDEFWMGVVAGLVSNIMYDIAAAAARRLLRWIARRKETKQE